MRLRMGVLNVEDELLHRVSTYAIRCESLQTEILTPFSLQNEDSINLDPAFVDMMTKVVPFVQQCRKQEVGFDMQQLADVAGISKEQLYQQFLMHLNESPRLMMLRLRLAKVAQMLTDTDKSDEDISEELAFVSANYMIASFFHRYRQTPTDYRNSTAR